MKTQSLVYTRREAVKLLAAGALGTALLPACATEEARVPTGAVALAGASLRYPFQLPDLPYGYDALAPAIDARTMEIHHSRHHQGYTDKLNAALIDHPDLHEQTIFDLLGDLDALPEGIRTAVRNSGGGYLNHAIFWPTLAPHGGGQPEGDLAAALNDRFGSFAQFQQQFERAATGVFGSGWAWLVAEEGGELSIVQTANQDAPVSQAQRPVWGLDVWEHAYYLRYQNRRGDYANAIWEVVNWEQCATNYRG